MVCSQCGTENRAGRKFCSSCGHALAVVCPACGAANEPSDRFCGECGTSLQGDAAAPPEAAPAVRPAPATERRLVSVLFADLVGFTALSESRDAEEVRDLLSRYFDTCRRLIGRYGGTVEKFIGDAVMAVWGTPVAQEDDAERAVRAALDLTDAVAALGQEVGAADLRARAGVLTGEAAVTIGAQGQGMVAGDLVNTASRIQAAAPPGAVYVGDGTRRATEAAVVYEEAGEHELKGKAEPVRLHRALRVVAGARGALKSEGLEAPFVGRDRELRLVKDLFHSVIDEGKPHLVSAMGIAGIGKSRLAWEFYKYMDGLSQLVRWHRGRCLAYGEGVAYWALAEMVRGRADIVEGEDAASALAKLRVTLETWVPDPEERRWVEPRLSHLLGLEERQAREREDLFSAWRVFFERIAEVDPVVMVFEDVQWADASLLDFVEHLMDWSRTHPIFVMTLARPELAERRPNWGTGRSSTSISLDPLSGPAMEELLTGLVPGLPDELRRGILERSEGVPLYAVETVRMLLDRGLLVREGPVYRPSGPTPALEVPETLHALIAARLDGLSAEERRLLQDASVLGKTFAKPALVVLSGMPDPDVDRHLAGLVRKEVLGVQADPRSPERGQHGFLQDLVRRVAYETLSRRERKAKHLAAAAYLEETWGSDEEEIVEVVASHYLEAYRSAPDAPDAAAIKGKARDMLARAGERAGSLAAAEEAQRYFDQAADLADEPLDRADLLYRAGQMAFRAGRTEDAESRSRRSIELFESEGGVKAAAKVSGQLGQILWFTGHLDEAIRLMEPAFEVLSAEPPDEDLAVMAEMLGRLAFFSGDTGRSTELVQTALDIAEPLALPQPLADAMVTKSFGLSSRGHRQEALALLKQALEVALEADLPGAASRANFNLANFFTEADRYEDAVETHERNLALARRLGNRGVEWRILTELCYSLFMTGRWDEALAGTADVPASAFESLYLPSMLHSMTELRVRRGELDEAERLIRSFARYEGSEDVQERGAFASAAACLLRARGQAADALARAQEAIEIRSSIGAASQIFKTAVVEGVEAAFDLGEPETADDVLDLLRGMAPGEIPPFLRAQHDRLQARLGAIRGEGGVAEQGFKQAAGLFREIGIPFWMAVTLLEHGEWLAQEGRTEEAVPLLSEARDVFERLGAAPWRERAARGAVPVGHS